MFVGESETNGVCQGGELLRSLLSTSSRLLGGSCRVSPDEGPDGAAGPNQTQSIREKQHVDQKHVS